MKWIIIISIIPLSIMYFKGLAKKSITEEKPKQLTVISYDTVNNRVFDFKRVIKDKEIYNIVINKELAIIEFRNDTLIIK